MPEHFIRCQACGLPHPSEELVCPFTGSPVARSASVPPPSSSGAPRYDSMPASSRREAISVGPQRLDSMWPPRIPSVPPLPLFEIDEPSAPRPTRDAPLLGQLLHGRYRVCGVIAKGGMGIVYEGIHVGLQRSVAIKTIQPRFARDPAAVSRFRNEAAVIGRFGHPNIVEVYDMGVLEDGSPYLVMERLEGETLTQRLRRHRPLPIPVAIDIASHVASALVVTHQEGILHLDLKPDNLWLTSRDDAPKSVKVIDFGVARIIRRESSSEDVADESVAGTPAFMAPEQAGGARDLDGRVDIYALGMILYVMLTGRLPYKASTAAALRRELTEVSPMRVRILRPEVPKPLDALTMRAIAKDREERFTDAGSLLAALRTAPRDAAPPSSSDRVRAAPEGESEKVEYFLRESILPPRN